MKRRIITILLVLMLIAGAAIILYPTVSEFLAKRAQTRAIADYEKMIQQLDPADYSRYFEQAEQYNERIRSIPYPFMYYDRVEGYNDCLNFDSTGIMGYIDIPKLRLELPICHGTEEQALERSAGHLQGSSLPIGGPGTHAVISAHRGLPSAKLFSELDKLAVGDTFTITVLDRVMTYRVDRIVTVLPTEVDDLYISEGEDLCTLLTCTPYGINSHRLLVRGTRVQNEP